MIDERIVKLFNEWAMAVGSVYGPGHENVAAMLTMAQWIGQVVLVQPSQSQLANPEK